MLKPLLNRCVKINLPDSLIWIEITEGYNSRIGAVYTLRIIHRHTTPANRPSAAPDLRAPAGRRHLQAYPSGEGRGLIPAGAQVGLCGDRCGSRRPVPRHELIEPGVGVIGDAVTDIGKPRLRVDIVELRRVDQRIDAGSAPATAICAAEQPGLAAE